MRSTIALRVLLAIALPVLIALTSVPGAAAEAGSAAIVYTHEREPEYQRQLQGGQIQAVTINKRLRTLRVTLKDGRHVLARYPAHHEPEVVAALHGKGVTVTILTKSQAQSEAKKTPVHHKLRYIVGGILIAVIVIVAAVLLIDRRRKLSEERGPSRPAAPGDSAT
jgi:hypothetical protein